MHFVTRPAEAPVRVVTHINITYENGNIHTQRHYQDATKMTQVLNYLRLIDPYGRPAVDPEIVGGSQFYIELAYSDGSSKVYRQKAARYMQIDGGDWKTIQISLKRLAAIEANLWVLPGHGGTSQLRDEKKYNPYLR